MQYEIRKCVLRNWKACNKIEFDRTVNTVTIITYISEHRQNYIISTIHFNELAAVVVERIES